MNRYIKGFNDFSLAEENSEFKINENANQVEVSKKPIFYKGYYLTIWPFHNENLDPNMSWGFTISESPDGTNYISKTKGPAGNYQKCLDGGMELINHMVSRKKNETI
jgi:hypothetical protein